MGSPHREGLQVEVNEVTAGESYVSEGFRYRALLAPQSLCQPKGLVPTCHGWGCLRLRKGEGSVSKVAHWGRSPRM